ncbi:hypothetical protein SACS_0638 [Parasaccharibacter apium]|uniref:Uncharacterized protein n=1 Tax=Parasaccharibacter apium TaxID=1510841 RepID=A0A7U7J0S8_9PROT|nr:hypothetical protein SACS_0638 [Parasaccharibacter apium]
MTVIRKAPFFDIDQFLEYFQLMPYYSYKFFLVFEADHSYRRGRNNYILSIFATPL